jgi:hypothetical protein
MRIAGNVQESCLPFQGHGDNHPAEGDFPLCDGALRLKGLSKEPKKGGRSHTFALFVPLRSLARKKMRKLIWTS